MTQREQQLSLKAVVRLLRRADRFNRLAKQCPPEHRRSFYRLKDTALTEASAMGHAQFEVDSIHADAPLTLGLTHRPSGRQVHIRPYRLPGEAQLLLHAMARSSGVFYPLLRLSDHEELQPIHRGFWPHILRETVA